jgi:hypothetical protein
MKTMNNKNPAIAKAAIVGAFVLIFGFLVTIAAAPGPFLKERSAVLNSAERITEQKQHVQFHRVELQQCRESNDDMGAITAKTKLSKAKADLKRDKAYLKADKKALEERHYAAMDETAVIIAQNKRELWMAKKQLKRDMRQGNTSALVRDAELVANHQKALDKSMLAFEKQEQAFYADLGAIDRELMLADERGKLKNKDKTAMRTTPDLTHANAGNDSLDNL